MSKTDTIEVKDEIEARLNNLSGWRTIEGPKLQRKFEFANFVEAFGFMTKVALLAEAMDHHPEWSNVYNVVTINLYKHEECAITNQDIELARKINQLLVES